MAGVDNSFQVLYTDQIPTTPIRLGQLLVDESAPGAPLKSCTSLSPLTYTAVGGGGGAQAALQFEDEGTTLGTAGDVDTVDFVGTGVSASRIGNAVTVQVNGPTAVNDAAQVYRAATPQSILNATETAVTFDTEVRDDGTYANLGVNNDRLTVSASGWYIVNGIVSFSPNSVAVRRAWIQINAGTDRHGYFSIKSTTTGDTEFISPAALVYLNAGDYVRLMGWQDSTSTLTITLVAGVPRLSITRVSGGGGDGGVLHVQDEKPSGTNGGVSAAVSFQTRTLNTVVLNTISGASLASNQFTLPAGTYDITASAPGHQCDAHRAVLYNVTDAANTLLGASARSRNTGSSDGSSESLVVGRFTIAATKVFELRHYTAVTLASSGLGVNVSSGNPEVYSRVFIRRIV